jgi:hypothetical protein
MAENGTWKKYAIPTIARSRPVKLWASPVIARSRPKKYGLT